MSLMKFVIPSLLVLCSACTYRAMPIGRPIALGTRDTVVILKPVLLSSVFRTPSFKRALYGRDEELEPLADSIITSNLYTRLHDHLPIEFGLPCDYVGVYQKLIPMVLRLGAEWDKNYFSSLTREEHGTFYLTDIGVDTKKNVLIVLPVMTWGRVYVSTTSFASRSTYSFESFTAMACFFLINTQDHAISYCWTRYQEGFQHSASLVRQDFTRNVNRLLNPVVRNLIVEADSHVQQLTAPSTNKDQ
jgi:hypothetical protein